MTYQTKAPKKAYFAEGFKAGWEECRSRIETCWDYTPSGNDYIEQLTNIPSEEPSDEDIDSAWEDYCEYWKNKAMEKDNA